MLSAIRHPDVIDKYLRDELEANRLVEVIGVGINEIHISSFEASGREMASAYRFVIPSWLERQRWD